MKIIFLTSYVDPGSGASILVRLAERLKQEGHEVRILATMPGFDSDIIKSVRLRGLLGFINTALNKLVPNYFGLNCRKLLAEIREYNPDVINIHWTHGPTTIPVGIIPKLDRIWPVFWTIHDLWPITANTFFEYTGGDTLLPSRQTPLQKLKRKFKLTPNSLLKLKVSLLGKAGIYTISPSEWMQKKVAASPVFGSATNLHIPNGVDTSVFKPLDKHLLRKRYGVPDNDKVILFLSANLADTRKGFYYFSRALENLKKSDPELLKNVTTLLIGGNSEGANKYLPTNVQNLGNTKDISKLVEYYNLADIFVSASLADNFPSTSLESLACGTPVVAFDVGGVSEIVKDGETGLLSKSMDTEGLSKNIRKILLDGELRTRLSEACRSFSIDQLDMSKFVDSYLEAFKNAQAERSSGNRE